jgi:hypothetical protein
VPYSELKAAKKRPLGLLKSTARIRIAKEFALTDDEFLGS